MTEEYITVKAYWHDTFVAEMTGNEIDVGQFSYEMLTKYECTSIRISYHGNNPPFGFMFE